MITQRNASARALVIISTIVAALVLLLATAVHAFTTSPPIDTVDYTVRSGDSLWTIAEAVATEEADLRAVVTTISELNELTGSVIHAGEVLEVPAHDG
jgi:LysM repeat protein